MGGSPPQQTSSQPQPCWWCGAWATTAEHRIKRSDLTREFGKGPYRGDSTLVRFSGGDRREIQGPGSQAFKFERSLCAACNNARSQAFDRAYETFGEFAFAHEDEILRDRRLLLPDVFGTNWGEPALDLMRYVAKHAGCRITDLAAQYPATPSLDSLRRFLDGGGFPDDFEVEVAIDWGWRALHRSATVEPNPETGNREGVAHVGDVHGMYRISTGEFSEPQSSFGARWLIFHWRLGVQHENPVEYPTLRLATSDRFGVRGRVILNVARWRYQLARRLGRVA